MKSSEPVLTALLSNRIDHSGVFPPTALSFEEALKKSASFSSTLRRPYLIGTNMVLPVSDLARMTPDQIDAAGFSTPLSIALIMDFVLTADRQCDLAAHLTASSEYNRIGAAGECPRRIVSLEMKIDPRPATVEMVERLLTSGQYPALPALYLELPLHRSDLVPDSDRLVESLVQMRERIGPRQVGVKVRAGGAEAATREACAFVLERVSRAALPFKVTGGLHYPLPRSPQGFGFLTLSIAVALSRRFSLPASEILTILSTETLDGFGFEGELSWRDCRIPAAELSDVVGIPHFSIGCCNPSTQDEELGAIFDRATMHSDSRQQTFLLYDD